jgi:hypothetical protein
MPKWLYSYDSQRLVGDLTLDPPADRTKSRRRPGCRAQLNTSFDATPPAIIWS